MVAYDGQKGGGGGVEDSERWMASSGCRNNGCPVDQGFPHRIVYSAVHIFPEIPQRDVVVLPMLFITPHLQYSDLADIFQGRNL